MRVVILGGGTAGWMTAAGLRRGLRPEDYPVTLVESEDIGTVGVGEATLPHIKQFNDWLGLDEAHFMRATRATFKLGIEFQSWNHQDHAYLHPFGAFGEPWAGVEFQHHWLRARRHGLQAFPLQDFSYAVMAARSAAFEFPNEDRSSIRSTYRYAYHFDASLYAAYLRAWATQRGVRRVEGKVREVSRNPTTGDLTELVLHSGERIAGDLFVDCSGFRSLLLGGVLGVAWEDWSHWLPCDRALAVPCNGTGALTPYTRVTAREAGWTWRIPLQHRVGNGYVYSSRFISDEAAHDSLLAGLESAALAEPRSLQFSPGRRVCSWTGNCVAIGLASGFLEPLESTSIYLIQTAVTDLIHLMPSAGAIRADSRLSREFNRLSELQFERIRDFLVLHYYANSRVGQPFWDFLRSMALPETLEHKLSLFRSRGMLPSYQYGLFSRDSWLAVLVGQGIEPRGYDPLAEVMPLDTLDERLRDFRERIATNVAAMTSHGTFVADYCGASETPATGSQETAT
jgi:tryptophan halogenase